MRIRILLALLLLAVLQVSAQQVVQHKQRHFKKSVPAGNYSGITWLGGARYAVVDDKSPMAGFHLMRIQIDSISGKLKEVRHEDFVTNQQLNRDEEGICYVPAHNTVFVSGEADGEIIEYQLDGQLTGRRLHIPEIFRTAYSNGSFEALTYNAHTHRFWTTSENTLKADGELPSIRKKIPNRLPDASLAKGEEGNSYLGVSGLAALDNGQLIVLEREIRRMPHHVGSFVHVKLYLVNPSQHQAGALLEKQLLTEFRTKLNLTKRSFANYEGICVGPKLADGRQVLLLVADSQNQYKGVLKDWFKTIVVDNN